MEWIVVLVGAVVAGGVAGAAARHGLARERSGAANELSTSKALIDEQVRGMREELARVTDLVSRVERERASSFGQLSEQLHLASRTTAELASATRTLREALSSSRTRGQWGERMAEDVLRLAGFQEGVNYRRQTKVAGGRTIPDFTFLLPGDRVVHLDVKFPLDNYLRAIEADREADRQQHTTAFLRDVRARVKELATRGYIDPANGTLDYVLLFIPNEQLYGFVHEQDPGLLDDALAQRVVLCSPLTLFAVLAVIRQAVDNFALEQASSEVLDLLGAFEAQWDQFTDQLDRVGTKLDQARNAYDELAGPRRRQLERPLSRLGELRTLGEGRSGGADARSDVPSAGDNLAEVREFVPDTAHR